MSTEHMNPEPNNDLWKEGIDPSPIIKQGLNVAAEQIRQATDVDAQQVKTFRDFVNYIGKQKHDTSRRYAYYRIGYNRLLNAVMILMGALPEYAVRFTKMPWPEGAECIHVREDPMSRSFMILLQHDSFDEVPDGAEFPVLNAGTVVEFEAVKLGKPEVD